MRLLLAALVAAAVAAPAAGAEPPDLTFQPAGEGYYRFDTGLLKGKLRLDGRSQGISTLIDVRNGTASLAAGGTASLAAGGTASLAAGGTELTSGGNLPGIFSYYRVFSTNTRYGHAARDWPTTAKVLPDGAVEVTFPPAEEHPLRMTAVYRWTKPDTLDLETAVTPQKDMPQFEVFLSSYFAKDTRAKVYVRPSRFGSGKPELLPADVNPLVDGTYLMFPRDLAAAQMIFDGRWEYPPNPVQWSVTRLLAGPMAVRHSRQTGLAAVVMSRPEDCFAVSTPYNKTPPDGVAGHASLYLSLFGRDLKAGRTARAHSRLVILRGFTDARAVGQYEAYCRERVKRDTPGKPGG